jgi:hexulose-6-phosphate isomerase
MDAKGYSRAKNGWGDILSANDDLPWADVRKALDEIGFAGWATAEVDGGGLPRLTQVHQQMQKAFGV